MLTAEQRAQRKEITGSFLPALMAGDNEEILDKYLELIGDPSWKAKRPTWAMEWGSYGEPFILDWHEAKTPEHPLIRRREVVVHPTRPFVSVTLDAWRAFDNCVIDAKVCGSHQRIDDLIAYYTPQIVAQRACLQANAGALLLVHGNSEPAEYPIYIDSAYEAALWERVDQFWWCVQNMVAPVTFPKLTPPEQWRTIDLNDDSIRLNWAIIMRPLLSEWDYRYDDVKKHQQVVEDIKELLPEDVGTVLFANLIIKRNRARAVSIKRVKP